MSPELRQGMINAAVVGFAIAFAAAIQQFFAPWLISLTILAAASSVIGAAFSVVMWVYGTELKKLVQQYLAPRRARIVTVSVLAAEAVAVIVLLQLPPVRVIRVVPGPELVPELGWDDKPQRLVVELDGKRFTLDKPQPRPVYAGASMDIVRWAIGKEDPGSREATLNGILRRIYEVPSDKIAEYRTGWVVGDPDVLQRAEDRGSRELTATFVEGNVAAKLTVRPVESNDGIETYVVDLP